MKISAVLITVNEASNIAECLEALRFCDECIVVDSGSKDRTAQIAQVMGAKVFVRAFDDFSAQKNFGIEKAIGEWVLLVDADERVSPLLMQEIKSKLENSALDGYYFKRRNKIFGRWMRFGINRGDLQLRLVRKVKAKFEGRVHERVLVPRKKTALLKNCLEHFSTATISNYMRKLNTYSKLEAEVLNERKEIFSERKLKRRPLVVGVYQGFILAGLLDGIEGFFFCVLGAYYDFVRRAKHWELTKGRGGS